MPLIRVELFDFRVNDETSERLIAGLTDALCAATHEGLRDHTWVIVEGHNPKNWSLGGKPGRSSRCPCRIRPTARRRRVYEIGLRGNTTLWGHCADAETATATSCHSEASPAAGSFDHLKPVRDDRPTTSPAPGRPR